MGYTVSGSGAGAKVTVNPDIDIKSSDNSVDVSSALENNKKTYDLKVKTATGGSNMVRITLTDEEIEAGTKLLDFTDVSGFIIETYDDRKVPAAFQFVASGVVDNDNVYRFNFPNGTDEFILKDGESATLIDSFADYPNGIYPGEVLQATPNAGDAWTLQKDSDITSRNGSIEIRPNTPKGYDLSVHEAFPVAYAGNAEEFNEGVRYLNGKGGGRLLITGEILFYEFADTTKIPTAERMYTIEDWTSRTDSEKTAGVDMTNPASVINFGNNLNDIYIEKHAPKAELCLFKRKGPSAVDLVPQKMYTLKATMIRLKEMWIGATNDASIIYELAAPYMTTQPYLIITSELRAENCGFGLQTGGDANNSTGEIYDITRPLKELFWVEGNYDWRSGAGSFPKAYILNPEFKTFYYVRGDLPCKIQSTIPVRYFGWSTKVAKNYFFCRFCYKVDEQKVLPDTFNLQIIDDRDTAQYGGSKVGAFIITAPGCVVKVTDGDHLISGGDKNRVTAFNSIWASNKLTLFDTQTQSIPTNMLTLDEESGLVKKSAVPQTQPITPSVTAGQVLKTVENPDTHVNEIAWANESGGTIAPSTAENQILRTVRNAQTQHLETAWAEEMLSGFETYSYIDAQESSVPYASDSVSAILVRCHPLADSYIKDLSVLITQGAERVFRLALYDKNRNLLGQTAETSLNQTGFVTLSLPAPVQVLHSESYLIGLLTAGNGYLLSGRTINIQTNNILPFVYQSQNNLTGNQFPETFNNEVKTGSTFVPYLAANSGV